MSLDLPRFYRACNPSRPLNAASPDDRGYYIDFSTVRNGDVVQELSRTITRLSPETPTTQLFTGHIGCGKSTELFRLKASLEQQDFHVVYFESDRDLEMADVDVSDIMLVIAQQVSKSLEQVGISLHPSGLESLFRNLKAVLNTPMEVANVSFSVGVANITARAKESQELRSQLRQYLEPRTKTIIDAINQELLAPAIAQLKTQGKQGLVVIVDNLDRVDNVSKSGSSRSQPEYLFVDRGEQMKRLHCHLVYTIPLALTFSSDLPSIANRFGTTPKVLSMVPVMRRDGGADPQGMALLQQMVLARAFPQLGAEARLAQVGEVFQRGQILSGLCHMSGGHMRNLMRLMFSCLQKQDPPIAPDTFAAVIRDERDALTPLISPEDWQLLLQAVQQPQAQGKPGYPNLMRSLLLFEYRDSQGKWLGINPILRHTPQFRQKPQPPEA
jgi:hypothetical protein